MVRLFRMQIKTILYEAVSGWTLEIPQVSRIFGFGRITYTDLVLQSRVQSSSTDAKARC